MIAPAAVRVNAPSFRFTTPSPTPLASATVMPRSVVLNPSVVSIDSDVTFVLTVLAPTAPAVPMSSVKLSAMMAYVLSLTRPLLIVTVRPVKSTSAAPSVNAPVWPVWPIVTVPEPEANSAMSVVDKLNVPVAAAKSMVSVVASGSNTTFVVPRLRIVLRLTTSLAVTVNVPAVMSSDTLSNANVTALAPLLMANVFAPALIAPLS